ncbi:MAG: ATP-binding cassette domain-containing protein [Bacilli bacterium]
MNAIEIKDLSKNFQYKAAVSSLNMTVPVGAIYGFIGENGSGKSTTEKIICGLLPKTSGTVRIFDKDYMDEEVKSQMGVLIEAPGCYANYSVWNNLRLQADNLNIKNPKEEIRKVLRLVRMEGAASNKFRNCSLGMKQRIGIAMALLGNPKLLILDEPINGLDADGMRIMREILTDLASKGCTILVSSHLLGELEKIATHYGIIRQGRIIKEMTAKQLDEECPIFVSLRVKETDQALSFLKQKYQKIKQEENGIIRIYDAKSTDEVASYLYSKDIVTEEISSEKISLEEYYINLMNDKEAI